MENVLAFVENNIPDEFIDSILRTCEIKMTGFFIGAGICLILLVVAFILRIKFKDSEDIVFGVHLSMVILGAIFAICIGFAIGFLVKFSAISADPQMFIANEINDAIHAITK